MSVFCFSANVPHRAGVGAQLRADAIVLLFAGLMALTWSARAESPQPLADSGYLLRTWGIDQGLPENSATAIAQTQDGYLWVGTFNGVARFNGNSFTVFNPANTPQLPSAGIVNLHVDHRDRLWVSTYSGLVVKDGNQWRALGTNEGWPANYVRTFSERRNGELLITTFAGQVLAVENDRPTVLPSPPGEPGQGYLGTVDETGHWWLAQNRFVGFYNGRQWVSVHEPGPSVGRSAVACAAARGGGIWVLLANELWRFRGDKAASRISLPPSKRGIWSMTEDSGTNLWICSYDSGLFQVTPGGELRQWTTTNGLGTLSTRLAFEDREENLWIGSSGDGLRRLTRQRFFQMGSSITPSRARSVSPARDGGMWMAFYDPGLFRLHEREFARIPVPGPDHASAYGLSVLEDRAGRLWYGDQDGCWWRRGQGRFEKVPLEPPSDGNVSALFEDSQGRVWIATRVGAVVYDGGAFQQIGPAAGLPRGEILGFGEDQAGGLWVAGADGVFRREKNQNQFVVVRGADGQPLGGVLCLKADVDGSMWLGTRTAGLIRWRNGNTTRVGVQHGLPEREVRGLIEDELGYFWMPSERGIVRASRKQLHAVADDAVTRIEVQLLDQQDGLPSPECFTTQPNCARDTAGRLWFATQKGVAMIDPAQFRLNSRPPPVHIEQLSYHPRAARPNPKEARFSRNPGDGEVRLTAPFSLPLRLPPGAYGLEIEFAALSFKSPEKVRYQYRLAGGGEDWSDAGMNRSVGVHQLPPGEYVFRVRAANSDGVWNETGASLGFSVLPFFWQTWWFRFGLGLLLAVLGGAVVWSWSRHRIARAMERERLAHETQVLREELAHASRVSTMGQLASALAHELGQPLGAILRNAEAAELMLREPAPDLAEIRAIMTDICQDDQRARGVIDRTRAMLKRGKIEPTQISVRELLQETARLARFDALQRKVQLTVEVPPDLPPVYGDRVQLQQVLLNLVLNAMDAMAGTSPTRRQIIISARRADGRRVEVRVCDNGSGITDSALEQVFDSFFTTKDKGMGMGLAVSRTIIEAHQGKIWAENRPEGGTCFSFTLPAADGLPAPHH